MYMKATFSDLLGKTLSDISILENKSIMVFTTNNGETYRLFNDIGCSACERPALIEDICGQLEDLIGNPLLLAEEVSICKTVSKSLKRGYLSEELWTFYKLATNRGAVSIRWYNERSWSYASKVEFVKILVCKECPFNSKDAYPDGTTFQFCKQAPNKYAGILDMQEAFPSFCQDIDLESALRG